MIDGLIMTLKHIPEFDLNRRLFEVQCVCVTQRALPFTCVFFDPSLLSASPAAPPPPHILVNKTDTTPFCSV